MQQFTRYIAADSSPPTDRSPLSVNGSAERRVRVVMEST